uniref:(California timema) hypothetical protein n=1 Tax=Timema californicum TaxID=61474 RepID=A0A7R9P921_TIMCA|nr:unnamed protein product [Timema californicum]
MVTLTLDEIISILDDDDDENILEAKVFMGPPENPLLNEEDSVDEDFISPDINNLSGNQLGATAELHAKHLQDTGVVMGQEDIPEEYLENVNTPDNENKSNRIKTISPFRNEVLELIVNCSNNYTFQKGNIKFKVTINEIKVFLGILVLSGYCSVPRYRMYWETSSDSHNEAVSRAISRNTFEDILKYLHVCDNLTLDESDKFVDKLPHGQHSTYVDNFFTSIRLLEELKSKGHYCTVTIRSNRVERASLEEAFTLKRKAYRGGKEVDQQNTFSSVSGLTLGGARRTLHQSIGWLFGVSWSVLVPCVAARLEGLWWNGLTCQSLIDDKGIGFDPGLVY